MRTLAQMIGSAFPGGSNCLCSPDEVAVSRLGRRRKLWELPHAYHCALIGTCLPVTEMRRLAPHSGYDVSNMTDYSLHTVVVGCCENRCALSEAIQRFLDKRHARAIARFAPVAAVSGVAAAWREALSVDEDIPGALWAAWTHAATDDELGREIHGDIHMLSHQVGAAVRADLCQLDHCKRDTERLQQELAALQQRAAMLATRAEVLEEWNAANARRATQYDIQLRDARRELAAAEESLAMALGVGPGDRATCARDCPSGAALEGRCVLRVGGRSGLVDGYRKLVEIRGGRFLHHDDGQEQSLQRIDAAPTDQAIRIPA